MKNQSTHSQASKLIKAELKAAFPSIKFTVKSQSYSGGDSVRIDYEDGPVYSDVTIIVDKYQYGSFDGMIDIYSADNVNADLPQVKYVLVQRSRSDETTKSLLSEMKDTYSGCEDLTIDNYYNTLVEGWREYASVLVHRLFWTRSY